MAYQTVLIVLLTLLLYCAGESNRERMQKNRLKARKLPQLDTCGLEDSRFNTKINNGQPVTLGEFPWMASLGYLNRVNQGPLWMCDGSLISNHYILTAADCIDPESLQSRRLTLTTVRLGVVNLDPLVQDGAGPKDFEVEKYIRHEGYNKVEKINDIGLVRTKEEVIFTDFIRPICLPSPEFRIKDFVGYSPILAGWAMSSNAPSPSNTILRMTELEIREIEHCRTNLTTKLTQVVIDDRVICATIWGGGSCQGSSGGPLMMYRRTNVETSVFNLFLMGVASYEYSCDWEGYPGVYTRVASYVPWIVDKMDI